MEKERFCDNTFYNKFFLPIFTILFKIHTKILSAYIKYADEKIIILISIKMFIIYIHLLSFHRIPYILVVYP